MKGNTRGPRESREGKALGVGQGGERRRRSWASSALPSADVSAEATLDRTSSRASKASGEQPDKPTRPPGLVHTSADSGGGHDEGGDVVAAARRQSERQHPLAEKACWPH